MSNQIYVDSEISALQRLIIHSPDSGLGKVVPSKAQDWLFEDIIHLETMRRKEYDYYVKLLLFFLDPEKIGNQDLSDTKREFFKPNSKGYFNSDKVIDFEKLLADVLNMDEVKVQLVAAVSAIEECSYLEMKRFLTFGNVELSKVLITGITDSGEMFFPPIPNLIFTRDIGIVVNDHILLNKPARRARSRESLLAKYIFFNHPLFATLTGKIIEIEEDEEHFLLPEDQGKRIDTLEGGDVMMVAPNHLLIGISERTTVEAARQVIDKLFAKNILTKISLIKIPAKRDYMHIDTIFTQIKRNVWVLLGSLARTKETAENEKVWDELGQRVTHEDIVIKQFYKEGDKVLSRNFDNLEELLKYISEIDLKCTEPVNFIYSGNNVFPFGAREQWTDSCNLLVLKEGVAVGYDRNDKTSEAFREYGFKTIHAVELVEQLEQGKVKVEDINDTIILLPSSELSRARGGSHCMSMPLQRIAYKPKN
ncbi:MAG TPA: arginine deiminase family protein [Leadbetterella sp.]|nr:arginine deiminase family protein [Leadbetterella sp.]